MRLNLLILVLLVATLAHAEDAGKPALPKVLIIGDSISIGYTPPVTALLKGRATVAHNPGNAAHSANGLAKLDAWLGDTQWDVIHFNHGLHDLKWVDEKGKNTTDRATGHIQIPVAEYEANLEAIVTRLEKTGAILIFATTTPYPDDVGAPLREPGMAAVYNEAALRVMARHTVIVNDLYAFVLPQLAALQLPKNVHFKPAGSQAMAAEVARHILAALKPQEAPAAAD
jgi:acyl-CoA thioesterase-1